MTKLKIFESPEFGTVRTVTINGEPETVRAMAPAPSPSVRRTAQRVANFVRIEP